MAIVPLGIGRVSNLLRTQVSTQAISATQAQLLTVQNELSTGLRVSTPSDDPTAASMIIQLQQTLARRTSYASNIDSASSQLGETDSTLGDLSGLLQQAEQIASADVGTNVTDAERTSAAAIVQSIYNQTLSIANKSFNNSFLFGGDSYGQAPFISGPAGLQYTGNGSTLTNVYDDGSSLPFQVSGASVFGALTTQVGGSANISPQLTATTRIRDIASTTGRGVRLGSFQLSNGTVTKTVDLSAASSIGDVVNLINQAAVGGITASISGQGLALTGAAGDNITVTDTGGNVARDLGIGTAPGGAGAGAAVAGGNLGPRITPLTNIGDLRNGLGIDPAGFTITNGLISKTINLAGIATVQDLLNAVNGSGSGVQASISPAGTGLIIANATQGSTLSISEAGGSTATELGIRSFSPATSLSQLNNGKGVGTAGGATTDFQIIARSGASFGVSLSAAQTVQDVINTINTSTAGAVTAGFSTSGNGIVLTDTTAGAGTLTVTPQNFSTAATDLGLTPSAVGNVITGTDVGGTDSAGLFGNLSKLIAGLQSGNKAQITAAGAGIQTDIARVTEVQGQTGAIEQELQSRQSQITNENTATKSFVSQLQDTDFASTISQFQTLQTALQASYQTAAKQLNMSLMDFLR